MSSQSKIPDADEVVIKLDMIDWNRTGVYYARWWETPEHPEYPELMRKRQVFLDSAASRIKAELLKGRVPMRNGYFGKLHYNVIYGEDSPAVNTYTLFTVVSTKPDGDVRVANKTKLTLANRPETTG